MEHISLRSTSAWYIQYICKNKMNICKVKPVDKSEDNFSKSFTSNWKRLDGEEEQMVDASCVKTQIILYMNISTMTASAVFSYTIVMALWKDFSSSAAMRLKLVLVLPHFTVHIFKQFLLEDIRSVALACSHEKWQKLLNNEKWELREKFKPSLLSQLHTADQSQREVGVIVGSSVSESYGNGRTQPPQSDIVRCEGRGFGSYSTIWQVKKHTGPLSAVLY